MDNTIPVILLVSSFTVISMIVISSIMYYVEREKRQLQIVEYWLSNGAYFVYSYFAAQYSPKIIAIGTFFWVWRLDIIRRIIEETCQTKLWRSWIYHLVAYSYIGSLFFAFMDLNFVFYTLPQALAVFLGGMIFLCRGLKVLRARGKVSVNHYLLFLTIFIIFLHLLDYPFYRFMKGYALLGFAVSLMCNILMAIVLPAVTIYELRREKERQLEKLLEERSAMLLSQSKLSALGEMTAGIAHEINNPLGIITNRTSHLRSHVMKDSAQKDFIVRNLDQIEATSERMAKIINSLRNFSRDNKNEPFVKVPICRIVDETLAYCHDRFYLSGIKLEVDPYPQDEIECRVVQISQVLLNLLNNSFDAVLGSDKPWVKISFENKESTLLIKVTDSVNGIPEAIRKKIMEPFFTTKEESGTGIGLSISKGIVEDHKGRLFYDESSSHTRFVIELPYLQS